MRGLAEHGRQDYRGFVGNSADHFEWPARLMFEALQMGPGAYSELPGKPLSYLVHLV